MYRVGTQPQAPVGCGTLENEGVESRQHDDHAQNEQDEPSEVRCALGGHGSLPLAAKPSPLPARAAPAGGRWWSSVAHLARWPRPELTSRYRDLDDLVGGNIHGRVAERVSGIEIHAVALAAGEEAGQRIPSWPHCHATPYTTGEVAEMLGYTSRWVRRQIEAERLTAYAFDAGDRRTFRVRADDLDSFRRRFIRDAKELPPKSER